MALPGLFSYLFFINRNIVLNAIIKEVTAVRNYVKHFFYRRHYELIYKYNVGLKTLLQECLSRIEFYGDLL